MCAEVIKKIILSHRATREMADRMHESVQKIKNAIRGKGLIRKTRNQYIKMNKDSRFSIMRKYNHPCLSDFFESAGTISSYFWQDLWAAKLISQNNPKRHFDIGSRIDGFIAHLASFRDGITLIDVRPLDIGIPGVDFVQANATNLENIEDNSIESLSALCSLEHFGMGRYGDPVSPNAWEDAIKSIVRVLAPGGDCYISVPIGWQHIEWNAHRIFYPSTIVETFKPLVLVEFSSCYGKTIEYNVDINKFDNEKDNHGGRFGLFHFKKEVSSDDE